MAKDKHQPKPTPKNVVLGEGAFYFNYDEEDEAYAGVTRGGGTFNREPEFHDIEFDGARGPVKGMKRKTEVESTLTLNALELQADNLIKFYAGLKKEDKTDYESVTAKKDIDEEDYLKNVAFVGQTKDSREVIIILKNALGDGSIELSLEDKDEVVPEVQFTGHFDLDDLESEPWEIRWPKTKSDSGGETQSTQSTKIKK